VARTWDSLSGIRLSLRGVSINARHCPDAEPIDHTR
jgi:hypothetical protein